MLKNIKMRVCKRYIQFKKGIKRINDWLDAIIVGPNYLYRSGIRSGNLLIRRKTSKKIKNYQEEDLERDPT